MWDLMIALIRGSDAPKFGVPVKRFPSGCTQLPLVGVSAGLPLAGFP